MSDQQEALGPPQSRASGARAGPSVPPRQRPKVGFLFNHEALHQVAHSAPVITELTERHPEFEVSILTSSDEQLDLIHRDLPQKTLERVEFVPLRLSPFGEGINRIARHISPFKRVAILRSNLDTLGRFDALVVPEATTTMLKSRFGLEHLKLIYTHHGAGDRSVGFGRELKLFDLILVSGAKLRDRLLFEGLVTEGGYAVIGYPKFDSVLTGSANRKPLFPNDRPTVLYNPHFEPRLSSWYTMGRQVLEFFAESDDFNLIVAPHVMLNQRRLHMSLEHFGLRIRRSIPEKYSRFSHIRIDLGSESCIDMTYTLGADIYLGDASSQVYEFILNPRPCIFLNSHGANWAENPDYLHWTLGSVIDRVRDLPDALARAEVDHATYRPIQAALFAETVDRTDVPSSRRAADAIAHYLLDGSASARRGAVSGAAGKVEPDDDAAHVGPAEPIE